MRTDARVSSEGDRQSTDRQVADLRAFAEKEGIEVVGGVRGTRKRSQGRLLFTIFSGVSQFERELIRERTMEGLASARARGRMGGRPGKDKKTIDQALTLYDSKAYSVDEISKTTGISRATLYKYVNLRKEAQNNQH